MTDAPNLDNAPPPTPTPPPVVTPPPQPSDWRASLPDDIKASPTLAKFQTAEGLAKSYINLEKQLGADKIVIPKEGDAEGWAKAFDALGRPKEPSAYEFKAVTLPDGMEYDKALEDSFRPVAHALGFSQKQAQGVRDWFVANRSELAGNAARDYQQERAAAEGELKRELGNAYDGYVKAAKAAISQYADPKFVEYLESSGLGNHPEMVRIFGKIGRETLGEDKLKASGVVTEDSPRELSAKIATFRAQHHAALYDQHHVEHNTRVAELTALTTRLHGDKPVQS